MQLLLAQQSPVQFASPLGATAWAILLGVPVGIIALYFLKLRRKPMQVSSTLLWRRSLEDLHVNSLFQRLRRNLLLFLQLLAVLLAMLALLGPRVRGTVEQGQRFVIAIDNSASMSATDVSPSRLEKAKDEAKKIIDAMESGDLAMVIAFNDRAKVISNYTGNRSLLRQRINGIEPTQATTSLREALQVAAGLANPSKDFAALQEGVVATAVIPPKLLIYTDGGFPDVEGFSLGNLQPEVIVLGEPPEEPEPVAEKAKSVESRKKPASDNVAVLALQAARNEEKPDQFQVFGRVRNYRAEPVATEAKLLRHDPERPGGSGELIDAVALKIDPQSEQAFQFDLPDTGGVELEVRIEVDDALPLDNRAFTVFGNPRKAQVLLVTPGNRYLTDTLKTATSEKLAEVVVVTPDEAATDDVTRAVAAGRYDLVIYDRFRPETPPEANALYFGTLPPGKPYENPEEAEVPVILDWDVAHPLMQYIRDLAFVRIAKAQIVEPPPGSNVLIGSDQGPIAFVAPRGGFVDAVVTFALIDGKNFNTDWPLKYSFPLFVFNSIRELGNARESAGNEIHQPGQPVVLRASSTTDEITVTNARGRDAQTLKRTPQGTFVYNDADQVGIYHARWGDEGTLAFPVNLFDERESSIAPRGLVPEGVSESEADAYRIKIGYNPVKGTRRTINAQKDWWKPLTVLVLGVLLFEWYIYNRRVYL